MPLVEKPITTENIIEMSQSGATITADMDEVLLQDTRSEFYKEHLTRVVNEILLETDLDNLAHELAREKEALDALEEQEFAEKAARAEEDQKERDQEENGGFERAEYQLTPEKLISPTVNVLKTLAEFTALNQEISATRNALKEVQASQDDIRGKWRAAEQSEANQFIQTFGQPIPVLLPNGKKSPANLVLRFDPASPEALELKQRLAAAPLLPDMLNTLEKSDMRNIFDKQVVLQQQKIRRSHPALAADSDTLELAARQQAGYDLNLDLRQLQNKFLLSITAIYSYMKRQGMHQIKHLVENYNQALGIDVNTSPHKQVGIYKIIEHAISPFLTPKLTMDQRKQKRVEVDKLDLNDLQLLGMKGAMQEQRLRQQGLAKLSSLRSLVLSLRHVASANPEFAFLHDICDRVAAQANVPKRNNNLRLPLWER